MKVYRKNENETALFNAEAKSTTVACVDDATNTGPGHYNTDYCFGSSGGRAVLFDRLISREDQIGPFGEKPAGALNKIVKEDKMLKKLV